ncbi:unnamed protein product, partial [marine sediment metagenome]
MIEEIVNSLKRSPRYKDRVEHIEVLASQDAVYGVIKKDLPQNIKDYLRK